MLHDNERLVYRRYDNDETVISGSSLSPRNRKKDIGTNQ